MRRAVVQIDSNTIGSEKPTAALMHGVWRSHLHLMYRKRLETERDLRQAFEERLPIED